MHKFFTDENILVFPFCLVARDNFFNKREARYFY